MAQKLTLHLLQLRLISPKLNKATDDAIETVKLVEQFLGLCSIGLHCDVEAVQEPMTETSNLNSGQTIYLAYCRVDGKYRIAVERYLFEKETVTHIDTVAWQSAARFLKMRTFPYLPALLEKLVAVVKEAIELTEGAAEIMDDITAVITPDRKL